MFFNCISRQNQTLFSSLISNRLFSSSLLTSSKLQHYGFDPPLSFPQNPNPNLNSSAQSKTRAKKQKPLYRPPSSLDRSGLKPLQSDLPFDFRYSYTESNSAVRPIGLREPKYSPFGPKRLDRVWTGVCAPAVDPTVKVVEGIGDPKASVEKARQWREKIIGEPLTPAERKILVERSQRNKTKRQVNLGDSFALHYLIK